MDEDDFEALAADNVIVARALRLLAATSSDEKVKQRAADLARRYDHFDHAQLIRAARRLSKEALRDGETCTSIGHELYVLAERALRSDAEAVIGLASRK